VNTPRSRIPGSAHAGGARRPVTLFTRRVIAIVRRIPPGRVASYGAVARLAGRPRAARAVGTIMRRCNVPGVPCHRVIAADGRLAGYAGVPDVKRALLQAEGILVRGGRVRSLADVRWPGSVRLPRKAR
jgi:methylated-DNA-protein-cysteine methyltransferase-like protein